MARGNFAGVVSAATPEAAATGARMLERGGNAIDAAVAVSPSLGVTEPAGSGIGGQTGFPVQRPGTAPTSGSHTARPR